MRSEQRKLHILKVAQEDGFVSIPKTAVALGVSVETIRRDVDNLCRKNQLRKVYGGATPIKSPRYKDDKLPIRLKQNPQSKLAIIREAMKMIQPGSFVSMDCDAMTERMAEQLHNIHSVSYLVNSLRVATILADKINAGEISGTIIMTGGQIITSTYRSYTLLALETVSRYHADIAFVSATALSVSGASNSATNTAIFSKHLLERAATRVLLVESYKLGRHSTMDFAKLSDFDRIITDNQYPCPADILEALQDSNTKLTIVSCEESR